MFEKQKERKVAIAKNLLLEHTCENCGNRSYNYYCSIKGFRSPMHTVERDDTCEYWRKYDGVYRPNIMWT